MPDIHANQTCPPNTVRYQIQPGDTLYSLARRYGTTVAAIQSINPGLIPESLQVARVICIPRQPVYPSCPGGNYYVVRQGDTMYAIARRYNVTVTDLAATNPTVDPNMLVIGQVLCVPSAPSTVRCPPNSYQYRIVAGDTMYSIARRYGVSLQALLKLNTSINPNKLEVGQIICIPG